MPSWTKASLYGLTAGWPSGSRSSSVPSGASGETTVSQRASPRGDVVLLHEAERLGVEAQRLLLVVDEDAGQVDPHGVLSGASGLSHRVTMCSSGSVFRSWNL